MTRAIFRAHISKTHLVTLIWNKKMRFLLSCWDAVRAINPLSKQAPSPFRNPFRIFLSHSKTLSDLKCAPFSLPDRNPSLKQTLNHFCFKQTPRFGLTIVNQSFSIRKKSFFILYKNVLNACKCTT
jgi:hypothetical protein